MLRISLEEIDRQIQNFYDRYLSGKCEDRRNLILISSNLESDLEPNGLNYPKNLKLNEKILLGVIHWYMPEELRVLTNLWLSKSWGGEFEEVRDVLLHSKDYALTYLLVSDRWNERDFFGNVLKENNLKNILRFYVRKIKKSPVKRKVWRRGYQDHGSLRPQHLPEPVFDYRKLLSVEELILREDLKRQKRILLENEINLRLEYETYGQLLEDS